MGAGDRVVAVGSYDRYPPEAERLPRVGALLDPNVERILALRPDLVIVYGTQTELSAQLDRAHIPVYSYTHRGLSDVTATIRALGARVGVEAQANGWPIASSSNWPPSGPAWPAGRGRERCWCSAGSRDRSGTSTRAAATASSTTCSRRPEAPTSSVTSIASR